MDSRSKSNNILNMALFNLNFNRQKKVQEEKSQEQEKELGFYYTGYKENYSQIPSPRTINRGLVFWGVDNLYPDFLLGLYKSSPIHQAIIDTKIKISCGETINYIENSPLTAAQKIELLRAQDFIDGKQKFKNLLYKIAKDYHIFNAYAVKITWDKKFETPLSIKHVPIKNLRIRTNSDNEIVEFVEQDDWIKPNWKKTYVPFSLTNKTDREQLYYYFESDENPFYGEPDYSAAINYINADCQIAQYYNSALENGFQPNLAFKFYFQPKTKEQKEEFRTMLRQTHQGVKKAGDPIILTWPDKDTAPDIVPITNENVDKTLIAIVPDINEKIIAAHNGVSPLLWSVSKPGSLGNSTELETAYKIFLKKVGNYDRYEMEDFSNFIFKTLFKLPIKIELEEYKII